MIALDFPNAINSEERFYGRKQELEIMLAALTSRSVPVVVIGERRVGKTSIQNVALQKLKNDRAGEMVPLVVEPRGMLSVDQFVESVLSRLSTWAGKDLRDTGLLGEDGHIYLESPGQFDLACQRLMAGSVGQHFLLCVDEFDEVIRVAGEVGEGERLKLMGLINHLVEKTEIPLILFLSMTRVPDESGKEVASALLAKCEIVELRPFTLADMSDMVRGLADGQAVFEVADLEWLHEVSGGHPYITKLLLANLFQRNVVSDAPLLVDRRLLGQALNDAVDDPRANYAFENIYRVHLTADEKRVLLYLVERDEGVDAGELREAGIQSLTAARNLEKRHYLKVENGEFKLRAQFLGHWLRNWAEFDEEIERLHVQDMVNHWMNDEAPALTDEDSRW